MEASRPNSFPAKQRQTHIHWLTCELRRKNGPSAKAYGARAVDRIKPIGSIDQSEFSFANVEDAIREFKADEMIVVVDDEDRENEVT